MANVSLIQNKILKDIAERVALRVHSASDGDSFFEFPFKHLILDQILPDQIARACLDDFPPLDSTSWEYSNEPEIEVKFRSKWTSEFDLPDSICSAVRIFNSALFLKAVGDRFQIPKLIPDPYFTGGGLNVTVQGGLLDVHVDGNYHDATGLNRRMNALLYLNPGWHSDWGGELGLYDSQGKNCIKSISPIFNRLVVFDSHDYSFHGLPAPINFPENSPRRSLILYYYTAATRPNDQVSIREPHSALWVKRNQLDKRGNRTRSHT